MFVPIRPQGHMVPLPEGCRYAVINTATRRAVFVGSAYRCKRWQNDQPLPEHWKVVSL